MTDSGVGELLGSLGNRHEAVGRQSDDCNLPTVIYRKERTEARGSPRRGSPILGYPSRLVKVAKVGRNRVKTELASRIAGLESLF